MSIYLTWLADVLRGAGCVVVEYDGWQTRARSSGGYAADPLCVVWHHTASNTSPANDASYMCNGSSDRPIANLLIARDGEVWVLAAGATNTNGKGGPLSFSRGTVPVDSMNTRALGVEIANTGVGEQYSQPQVDAMFQVSNACNARFGNQPSDLATHQVWAPTRKIDPATTDVAGSWQPTACTSSGTWNVTDVQAECERRSDTGAPKEEDDMLHVVVYAEDGTTTVRGPAIVGPGYWHYSRTDNEAFLWQKLYGKPRVLDNAYDFDLLMKTHALEPDDARQLGPT